ncbi:MAG: hypothetical protein J1F13_04905 [Prevotellaceae bacterium]|nr:hypothetical protein [Prevotellaceae bacterium]
MRKFFPLIVFSLIATLALGQSSPAKQKGIYIPKDLQDIDLNDTTAKWNWCNTLQSPDVIILWEQPFGTDPGKAPQLDGHDMTVDVNNVMERVQSFYNYFRDSLDFLSVPSNADSLKMMVMLNYSLESTAYGGTYDGRIGAMWVSPNRIQDRKLNVIAHELGHSFQHQIVVDGAGVNWGSAGFNEMVSQWMLWRVNPDWPTDENYHLKAFRNEAHRAYLSHENRYRSPYVIEYWAQRRGQKHIARLYREGRRDEDPAMTYMRVNGLTLQQYSDEMFDCYTRLLTFNFTYAYAQTRRHADTFNTRLDTIAPGHYRIPADLCPEQYGFNAIRLPKDIKANKVKVTNVKVPRDNKLRWAVVDGVNCRYLLVMNEPKKYVRIARNVEKQEPLPTISYDVKIKK